MFASLIRARPALRANTLLLLAALFLLLAANGRFWQVALPLAPAGLAGAGFVLAIGTLLLVLTSIVLLPLSFKPLFKPWLLFVLFAAAAAAYFMDHYGVVVDRFAIQSVAETDVREGAEWLSWKMLWTFLLLFALPAVALYRVRIDWQPFRRELWARIKLALALALALVLVAVLAGRQVHDLLKQTCAFDFESLDPGNRPVVMTSMVGVGVTVLAFGSPQQRYYRLWCDGTYGPYLWNTLIEVAGSLGGGAVGFEALGPLAR